MRRLRDTSSNLRKWKKRTFCAVWGGSSEPPEPPQGTGLKFFVQLCLYTMSRNVITWYEWWAVPLMSQNCAGLLASASLNSVARLSVKKIQSFYSRVLGGCGFAVHGASTCHLAEPRLLARLIFDVLMLSRVVANRGVWFARLFAHNDYYARTKERMPSNAFLLAFCISHSHASTKCTSAL